MKLVRRACMSFAVAAVACLALAPAANAAFGFQGLSAAPTNTNAVANSNFNIHIGFTSPAADVKDLTVGLPPGLVGDPTATPLCTVAQLQADSCASARQPRAVTAQTARARRTTSIIAPPPLLVLPGVAGTI